MTSRNYASPLIRYLTAILGYDRKQARAANWPFYIAPKPCKSCGTKFRRVDGNCLECRSVYQEKWRNRDPDAAKEYMRKAMKQWRSNDENRLKGVVYCRNYKARNRHMLNKSEIEPWYHRNKFKASKRRKIYYVENKDIFIDRARQQRAKRNNAEGFHSWKDLRKIRSSQKGMCAYCEESKNLHLDHMTPLSRGGTNWPDNLQYLCQFHNLSKWTKTDGEYRQLLKEQDYECRTPEQ